MATINGTNNGETIDETGNGGSLFGSDTINALGGDDTVVLHTNLPSTNGFIYDAVHGGAGTDLLVMDIYSPAGFTATDDGAGGYSGSYAETGGGFYQVQFDSIERFDLTLRTGTSVALGSGDDIVRATTGNATVDFGQGSDTLVFDRSSSGYAVRFDGGYTGSLAAGYAGSGAADYYGSVDFTGVENFQLFGGSAADTLTAGDGDDILSGGGGGDVLIAGKGTNAITGGAGTDALSIDLSGQAAGIAIDLGAAGAQQAGGTGSVTGVETFAGSVVGSAFADMLVEGNYAYGASFDMGGGNDAVTLRNGDDTVNGGAGVDTLTFDRAFSGYALHVTTALSGTLAGGYSGVFLADYAGSAAFSGIENFKIYGGSAADVITSGDGNDVLNGGGGSDTLTAGKGTNTIDGGAGTDVLSIDLSGQGAGVTIDLGLATTQQSGGTGSIIRVESFAGAVAGTAFADTLIEGNFAYDATFDMGAGDDAVTIRNGDDTVNGGAGNDTLTFDRSFSGYALHVTAAPAGALATGYAGTFQADYAGSTAFTGIENFKVHGGSAADVITTGDGDDALSGNGGSDTLTAGRGTNTIDGGAGTDVLGIDFSGQATGVTVDLSVDGAQQSGGTGSITNVESFSGVVVGSAYADSFVERLFDYSARFDTGAGNDRVQVLHGDDTINGGAGSDTLVFDRRASGYQIYVTTALTGDLAGGYAGKFGADYQGSATFTGIENFEVHGGSAADMIQTGDGNDIVEAGGGHDAITVGGGLNIVDGGAGTDRLGADFSGKTAGVTVDLLLAGEQQSGASGSIENVESFAGTVTGTDFADVFREGAYDYDAAFTTGKGNDTVLVMDGDDTIDGGLGNDTLVYDRSQSGYKTDIAVALTGSLASGYAGKFQSDYFGSATFAGIEAFRISGGSAADGVTTGDGADMLVGNGGNDTLQAAGGNDTVEGGAGNDRLDGGLGTDLLTYAGATAGVTVKLLVTVAQATGGAGTDTISGFENLTGSAFDDSLQGNNGDNTLTGGDGNDGLLGGLGNDYMIGGAGSDTASYITAGGGVTIDLSLTVAQNTGSAGMDRLVQIEGIRGTAYADVIKGNAAFNVFTAAEGDDQLWGFVGNDTLVGGTGRDVLYGGDGQDGLNGGEDDDLGWGEAGLGNLKGEGGNDTLHGGSENDSVNGGTGDDVLYGEGGRDILLGESGADRFVYTTLAESPVGAGSRDQIRDFSGAEGDVIDLSGIDAVTGGGDDGFVFIGSGAFTGVAGQLNTVASGTNWVVQGDVDGNGTADFAIQVTSAAPLVATDFML